MFSILQKVKELSFSDKIAAISPEGYLTYAQLEQDSEALASFLLQEFPEDDSPVMIWGDKENDMLSCVLAALKIGRSYVMVPNYYPEQRVCQIANSCEPHVILATGVVKAPEVCRVIDHTELRKIISDYAGNKVSDELSVKRDDTVCIFYTSGSTGNPKGVVVTRRNIEEMLDWWGGIIDRKIENSRMLNFTPYGFSSSLSTIYVGLGISGATLYAVDKEMSADYGRLKDFIYQVDPHYLDCTPTFADICMHDNCFDLEHLPSMTVISVCGEPCPHSVAKKLLTRFPGVDIIDGYGATETTIGPIACSITWEMAESDIPLPIGYVGHNARCEVWDENGKPVPDGETGELIVISDMVTMGYYKDSERTAAAFFTAKDGTRGYHTRDLVWRKNDLYYYVGRVDNMVKVSGYRVEMEEVERCLGQLPEVAACAVVPAMDDGHCVMLIAYVVLVEGLKKGIAATIAIKNGLSKMVQTYMVPQKVIYLDELPKNNNGKIDRNYLKEISAVRKEE